MITTLRSRPATSPLFQQPCPVHRPLFSRRSHPGRRGWHLIIPILTPLLTTPALAEGLEQVKTILGKVKLELLSMIPLIAVVALIVMGIGYALRFVGKETFIRWMVGLIIAGSAAQITKLFFQTTGQNVGL